MKELSIEETKEIWKQIEEEDFFGELLRRYKAQKGEEV